MPLKIAYLDDEQMLCEVFYELIASPEYEVHTFSSSEGFIEAVRTIQPDVVFLDYRLPGTTGLALAKQLDPKIRRCIITGDLYVDLEPDAQVDHIFHKPYDALALTEYLAAIVQAKSSLK